MDDRILIASLIDDGYVLVDYTSPTMDWLEEQGFTTEAMWGSRPSGRRALTEAGATWLKAQPRVTLFVNYTEEHEVIREIDPEDSWDQGVSDLNGRFESVTKTNKRSYNHKDVTAPAAMRSGMLVWCQYATGSTFGRTDGQFDAIGFAYTEEGVRLLEKVAGGKHSDYFGGLQSCYTETINFDEIADE